MEALLWLCDLFAMIILLRWSVRNEKTEKGNMKQTSYSQQPRRRSGVQ